MGFRSSILTLTISLTLMTTTVYCQITTPCSASMITSFTPCLNFLTNSTTNGTTTPTNDCCNSLRSITSGGTDCLCLIVTGSVPFQIPINRTLAISLPRACRMPGVPLQCKAAAAPVPPPGPAALGPTLSPQAQSTPAASPQGSTVPETTSPTMAPESDSTPTLTPPSTTTVNSGSPTTNSGSRPVLTPSTAPPLGAYSPLILLAMVGATLIKFY